jgi:hypothetical protein
MADTGVGNVAPIREGSTVVGYMYVRNKVTRQQIEQAEKHYQQMRDGKVPQPSLGARLAARVHDLPIIYKLSAAILAPVAVVTSIGLYRHDPGAWVGLGAGVLTAFVAGGLLSHKLKQSGRAVACHSWTGWR